MMATQRGLVSSEGGALGHVEPLEEALVERQVRECRIAVAELFIDEWPVNERIGSGGAWREDGQIAGVITGEPRY